MICPKIEKAKALENYILEVRFSDGTIKKVDFKHKLDEEMYADLEDVFLFNQVKVDAGGYGLSWNDDIDISEYELYNM